MHTVVNLRHKRKTVSGLEGLLEIIGVGVVVVESVSAHNLNIFTFVCTTV